MTYYPIQESGAAAQFPLARMRRWQTLETRTPGGYTARGLQPEARRVHWQLEYVDLSDAEVSAFTDLFKQSKGGLKSFVFVDPLANLMLDSERIGEGSWLVSSGMSAATNGGARPAVFRITNSSQGPGTVGQTLALPPGGNYCLSCWIKGVAGQQMGLRIGGAYRQATATGAWHRFWLTAPSANGGNTFCAVEVGVGSGVEVHSVQLEQQPAPSTYRAGTAVSGIYPETRFDQDSLEVTVAGPNRNGLRVKLVSRLAE